MNVLSQFLKKSWVCSQSSQVFFVYRVWWKKWSIFWEIIVSVIVNKKIHVSLWYLLLFDFESWKQTFIYCSCAHEMDALCVSFPDHQDIWNSSHLDLFLLCWIKCAEGNNTQILAPIQDAFAIMWQSTKEHFTSMYWDI